MSTRSIYQKVCPCCSALVALNTGQCTCGYSFETERRESELSPEELMAQQELLGEYLEARINQAVNQLQIIQAALVNDPKNLDKANKLMQAFSEVRELRAEIETQTANVAVFRNTARAVPEEPGMETGRDAEPAAPSASLRPTREFSAVQAAKVETIMHAAGIDTKECPKCHGVLPQRAALCFCGFAFPQNSSASAAPQATATSAAEHHKGF